MIEQAELEKLAATRAYIDAEIGRLLAVSGEKKEAVRDRNRDFLAENPFGAVYGAAFDMIRHNENELEQAEGMRREALLLERIRLSPYFGRVDFRFADDGETERIYVGLKTLTDGSEFFVYDWRAPISALFYLGELGRASYTAPAGEIGGEITLLRQYTFRDGTLMNHWDAQLHIDDEVLRNVLASDSAEKMRPIVCTIQREQNAAIRFSPRENLAVFGPAGSGKTSVGMHRLAWLMYRARSEGFPVSTLMLTSNEAFRSYLSGVLPELGEADTAAFSFPALFERYLPAYQVETALRQTEQLLAQNGFRAQNIGALYSPAFLDYADEALARLQTKFVSISVLGNTALSGEDIERRFFALPGSVPVRERLETVAQWVEDELRNYMLIHRKEMLSRLLETTERGDSYTERYLRLKKQVIEKSREMVERAVPADPAALLIRWFGEFCENQRLVRALKARLSARTLYFEDAVLLLYISVRLGNCRPFGSYTHVLIDEAQDLCVLQHKILRALFPKAVFTVLADVRQGLTPLLNTGSEETLRQLYGAACVRISKSYRSTKEISEFARGYLPEAAAAYETFDRHGPAPVQWTVENAAEKTAALLREAFGKYRSVGVLFRTAADAERFWRRLSPLFPEVVPVLSEQKTLTGGVLLMPAALAKGLEFDCVLIPVSAEDPPADHEMYLMTTRALHELHILREAAAESAPAAEFSEFLN